MNEYNWTDEIKDEDFSELIHQSLTTHTPAELSIAMNDHYIDKFKTQSIGTSLTGILRTTKEELTTSLDNVIKGITLINIGLNKLTKSHSTGNGAGYIAIMNESIFTPPGLKNDTYLLDVVNKFNNISGTLYDVNTVVNDLDTTMAKFLADEDFRTQLLSDGTDVGKTANSALKGLQAYFNDVMDSKVAYESRKVHEVLRNEGELELIQDSLKTAMSTITESNVKDLIKLMKRIDKKGNLILKELDNGDKVTKAALEALGNEIIIVANYITMVSKTVFFIYAIERSYLDIKNKI